MDEDVKQVLEACKAFIENLRVPQNILEAGIQIISGERLLERINSALETTRIDLDKEAYAQLAKAASESSWIPPEYYANDWIADCCEYLRKGHPKGIASEEIKSRILINIQNSKLPILNYECRRFNEGLDKADMIIRKHFRMLQE